MPPLVSIVVLCYNHAAYLDDCLKGLLSQTYRDLEVIITDDHSSDSSWEIVQRYQPILDRAFPRVVCQRNERNLGFFGALKRAQTHITGNFLCFLDGDDFYYPSKIARNVAFLAEYPGVGFVHSDVDFLFAESGRLERDWWKGIHTPPQGRVFESLVLGNHIMTCSMCCRTGLFQDHVDFRRYEAASYRMADHPMFLDLSLNTEFGYIDEALACYRVLPESASRFANPAKQLDFQLSCIQICLDYVERHEVPEQTRNAILRRRAKFLFEYGYLLGREDICREGYAWLCEHSPDIYGTLPNRLRVLASRYRPLRSFSHWWRAIRSLGRPGGGHEGARRPW